MSKRKGGKKAEVRAQVLAVEAVPEKFDRPIVEMELVERPKGARTKWEVDHEADVIMRSLDNGKAYRLRFRNSEDLNHIRMALQHRLGKSGMSLHGLVDPEGRFVCWAERKKAKGAP